MEEGYGLRKRKVAATPRDTSHLVRQAAAEVVQGMHGGSCRRAAIHHGLDSHSGIHYHVSNWRRSELGELVAELPQSTDSTPRSEVSEPTLLSDMPSEVSMSSRFAIKQWMAKQAAHHRTWLRWVSAQPVLPLRWSMAGTHLLMLMARGNCLLSLTRQ